MIENIFFLTNFCDQFDLSMCEIAEIKCLKTLILAQTLAERLEGSLVKVVEARDAKSIEFGIELHHLSELVKDSDLNIVLRDIDDFQFANTFNFFFSFRFYCLSNA